jgi:hypothetical protein
LKSPSTTNLNSKIASWSSFGSDCLTARNTTKTQGWIFSLMSVKNLRLELVFKHPSVLSESYEVHRRTRACHRRPPTPLEVGAPTMAPFSPPWWAPKAASGGASCLASQSAMCMCVLSVM